MKLDQCCYYTPDGKPFPVFYRPETSDEKVLTEVVDRHCYRRSRIGFDVEQGETWLDLGANIGAFAVYCRTRGAKSFGFEPDPFCYAILKMNMSNSKTGISEKDGYCNSAVTNRKEPWLQFYKGRRESDHYRGTAIPTKSMPKSEVVNNCHGSCLRNFTFDGVKMDVEGSEGGLIDEWLMPKCKKLVIEYHTSRDPSAANLKRRLMILRSKFDHVKYPAEYDRIISAGVDVKTFFDRTIHAWND
jgi:FkbM family methyltransferase